jgi:hypothetical protein
MFDLLIRALLHHRANLRRPCIATPFMLLFNTCLLYNQLCVSFICGRARLPPPPIAAPIITIQAMCQVHSPSYVILFITFIAPHYDAMSVPFSALKMFALSVFCVKRHHPCICCRLEEGCYVPVSPVRQWWRCGAWKQDGSLAYTFVLFTPS